MIVEIELKLLTQLANPNFIASIDAKLHFALETRERLDKAASVAEAGKKPLQCQLHRVY